MKIDLRVFLLWISPVFAGSIFGQLSDTTELDAVPVTATRIPDALPRIGRHLQVIDSLQLGGQARPEVGEVLRMGSLVDVRERGPFDVQTDLGIRGGTFDQALVLLDGVPLSDPQTGHHAMDLPLPTEVLERVEVLYGGASRTFGAGAFSGAVNLISREPRDNRGSLSLQGGQYGSYRAAVTQDLLLGKTGARIAGQRSHSGGYVANSDFNQAGGQAEVAHAFGKLRLRAQAGYMHKRFGAQNFYSSLYPDQQEVTGTALASVGVQYASGPWNWNAKAYFRQHDDLFELFREDEDHYQYTNGFFIRNGTDTARFSPTLFYTFHNRHRTRVGGAMANASRHWKGGTTAIGIHVREEHILSNVLGKPLATPITVAGAREVLTHSDERRNLALHADHRFSHGRWTLDGGVLLNLNSTFSPEWVPGLDAVYRWNKGHSSYASLGRAFRFPTWTDLYYNRGGAIGSANLQAEHADQLELGHRILREAWSLKLAAWRRQGRDLIDWVQRPGETTVHAANLTEVDLNGIELEVAFQAGTGRGGLLYAYQWADQDRFDFASLYVLDHLAHNVVGWWNQPLPKGFSVQVNATWKQRTGTYARFSDGALMAYPDPLRIALKAAWTHRAITLFASAYNLLDAEQVDRGNIALPGRWISGGLQLRWSTAKP